MLYQNCAEVTTQFSQDDPVCLVLLLVVLVVAVISVPVVGGPVFPLPVRVRGGGHGQSRRGRRRRRWEAAVLGRGQLALLQMETDVRNLLVGGNLLIHHC